jgi:hypothetical protein
MLARLITFDGSNIFLSRGMLVHQLDDLRQIVAQRFGSPPARTMYSTSE